MKLNSVAINKRINSVDRKMIADAIRSLHDTIKKNHPKNILKNSFVILKDLIFKAKGSPNA